MQGSVLTSVCAFKCAWICVRVVVSLCTHLRAVPGCTTTGVRGRQSLGPVTGPSDGPFGWTCGCASGWAQNKQGCWCACGWGLSLAPCVGSGLDTPTWERESRRGENDVCGCERSHSGRMGCAV